MIIIRRIRPDEGMPDRVKWLTLDTKAKSGDACATLSDAIRCFFWRLGVPARIAFRSWNKHK
jgi:hypothetical protein